MEKVSRRWTSSTIRSWLRFVIWDSVKLVWLSLCSVNVRMTVQGSNERQNICSNNRRGWAICLPRLKGNMEMSSRLSRKPVISWHGTFLAKRTVSDDATLSNRERTCNFESRWKQRSTRKITVERFPRTIRGWTFRKYCASTQLTFFYHGNKCIRKRIKIKMIIIDFRPI